MKERPSSAMRSTAAKSAPEMNYFEFFGIPVAFVIDEAALKQAFYANSKKYHPDFYTLADEEKQAEILELSTLNNKAYQTLQDFDKRMAYILELKEVFAEEGANEVPQDFLMEMMDINEALMELEFDFDPESFEKVQQQLQDFENQLYSEVEDFIVHYDDLQPSKEALEAIKEYYFKRRYLLRIRENLSKFATH